MGGDLSFFSPPPAEAGSNQEGSRGQLLSPISARILEKTINELEGCSWLQGEGERGLLESQGALGGDERKICSSSHSELSDLSDNTERGEDEVCTSMFVQINLHHCWGKNRIFHGHKAAQQDQFGFSALPRGCL